jgi:WD40 repeat protein
MRPPDAAESQPTPEPQAAPGGATASAFAPTLTGPADGPAAAEAGPPAVPGFDLLDEVGRGGMGVVYRARDRALDREVAVKVLQEQYAPHSAVAARFVDEARITAQLQHPGVPAVYQVGALADGRPFLAMKLIKGQTLDALLKRGAPVDTLAVFEAISQAVGYAHAHGVIHRDLKPGNVMVGAFGEVQVMDWGLAKVLAPGGGPPPPGADDDEQATTVPTEIRTRRDSDGSHTQAGSVLGTPAYMAPEQAAGELDKVHTPADVFGLGAILCVLLTGRPPFEGKDAEAVRLSAVRGKTEPALARLDGCGADPDVVALCRRCLAFEPGDRPATANEVAAAVAALRRAADERLRQAEHDKLAAQVRAAEQAKRRRAVQWAAGALAAVLLLGVAGTTAGLFRADAARRDAEAAQRETEGKRREADAAREAEERLRRSAEDTLYLNRISLADRECAAFNLRHTEELLGLCPPERRQWEWRYLMSLCHGELRSLDAHHTVVNCLARSPDGKLLASGGGQPYQADAQGTILLWDAATYQVVRTLRGHLGAVGNIAFTPDGEHLVSSARFTDLNKIIRQRAPLEAATRGEVRVWNVKLGHTELHMPGYTSIVAAPDGKTLAAAALGEDVRVWDKKTRKVHLRLKHPKGILTRLTYSPDGRWLAGCWQELRTAELARGEVDLGAGTRTGTLVWDARTGDRHMTLEGQSDAEFSPDSKRLATAHEDRTARLWDLATKKEVAAFRRHTHLVNGLAFSPDGRRLATASLDKTATVWEIDGARELRQLRGHTDMVTSVLFSADGDAVLTGSWDGTVKVWNAGHEPAFRALRGHTSHVANLAFAPDGKRIASAGPESVRLWDLEAGREVFHLDTAMQCVSFRHDGHLLATGGRDDTVRLWDVSGTAGRPTQVREMAGHTGRVSAVAFRPDGKQVASASTGNQDGKKPGEVYLWGADTGERTGQLAGLKTSVLSLSWRPDGRRLATLSADGSVRVWEPGSGGEVLVPQAEVFRGAYLSVGCVAYSPDGKLLAGAVSNALDAQQRRELVIWDAETGAERARMAGHSAPVSGLAFSPDGRRLAAASWDINRGATGEVKLWDVATGTEILTLPGHVCVAFSPDGRFLAGVGGDVLRAGLIKVWDGGGRLTSVNPVQRRE